MHPDALSKKFRFFVSLSFTVTAVALFTANEDLKSLISDNKRYLLLAILLIVFNAAAAYWEYSSPYFKLRDKIVSTFTDGTYGNKKSNLRALVVGLGVVLLFLALVCIYIIQFQ
jgi:hypothetical protein